MHAAVVKLLCVLVGLGWTYWCVACWCVSRRVGGGRRGAARRGGGAASPAGVAWRPPVSILKPLSGADPELLDHLGSFCHQQYPEYEIVLGVREADDPAVRAVQVLRQRFPEVPIRLLLTPPLGANPKTAILDHLVRHARHNVLVISDSDIRVGPDYLDRVVRPLADPAVGWVTCLYSVRPSVRRATAVLEALYVDVTFLPAVALTSYLPGICFGLGATMALRRADLEAAGGYAAIADQLADDREVAHLLSRRLDLRPALSDVVVRHACDGESSAGHWWGREVRRARTLRVVEPRCYLWLPLTFATLWAVLLVAVSGGAGWSWGVLGATLALRWATAWRVAGAIGLRSLARDLPWLPLRDLLDVLMWGVALSGRTVIWRGKRYRLGRDGALAPQPTIAPNLGRRLVRQLDAALRRREGIFEYADDPACLFRIELRRAEQPIVLNDRTRVRPGDRLLELHFWNEHLPPMAPRRGADIRWAANASRRVVRSLALLAQYLESHGDLNDVVAIHGRSALVTGDPRPLRRLVERYGFEFRGRARPRGPLQWLHRRGEDLLIWGLSWTFNPFDRRRRTLSRIRHDVWMSRRELVERYSRTRAAAAAPADGRPGDREARGRHRRYARSKGPGW